MGDHAKGEAIGIKDVFFNTYSIWGPLNGSRIVAGGLLLWVVKQLMPKDRFDDKYGVATDDNIEPTEAGIADEVACATAGVYAPTYEQVVRHVLKNALRGLDAGTFSYVDLGCGMGRTLMLAAQTPFREIVGVELSPLHTEAARQNIERYLSRARDIRCRAIRVSCGDAGAFRFPDSDLLVYMYNPFSAPVIKRVADQLHRFQAATGRRVLVAYSCPVYDSVFQGAAGFVKRETYASVLSEYSWTLWEVRS